MTTVKVLVPGPPWVRMKNWLNARNEPMIEMIRLSAMVGRSSGSVMCSSFCHHFAPATSADSYRSSEMLCMPPRRSTMVKPEANQMTRMQVAASARLVFTSQAVAPLVKPSLARMTFTAPELGCNSSSMM